MASGYDRCAGAYLSARSPDPSPELSLLAERLGQTARILDIGCGAGLPVTAALARMGSVVGVDISSAQIELARANVPSARLIQGDIMAQAYAAASFDAVVAFYALFHLPRAEHAELIARVTRWTAPGGYLLATLPGSADSACIESDFFGVTMYWSHYDASWYCDRLEHLGWRILHLGELGHGFKNHLDIQPERHPVVLARLANDAQAGSRRHDRPGQTRAAGV